MGQAGTASSIAAPGVRQIELSIGGMTCAACAARVEKTLTAIPDVAAVVNFATEKVTVAAPDSVSVEQLIDLIRRAGYSAEETWPGFIAAEDTDGPGDAGDRTVFLRRRLIVALIFFIPLSDLSVQLSLFPAFRFTGWQWVLIALTLPVAGWAAWPFHAAALRAVRHGLTTMDTLVSLGIVAACGWSVYAMFGLDARQPRMSALAVAGARLRRRHLPGGRCLGHYVPARGPVV